MRSVDHECKKISVKLTLQNIHVTWLTNLTAITVFYNHFGTNFRTLTSFFKTLDTKLTTNDQNAHFSKLLQFFQLLGYNTHKPEIICSFNKDHLLNMTQLNIKVLLFQKAIHTLHFR